MARDFKFDPVTQDWIPDGKGSFVTTELADTTVMHQLLCRYRQWWGDPELGSRLFDLNSFQSNPAVLAAEEAKRCLNRLVASGRIANLEVEAEMQGPSRVVVATTFQDASTGQVVDTFAKIGGG